MTPYVLIIAKLRSVVSRPDKPGTVKRRAGCNGQRKYLQQKKAYKRNTVSCELISPPAVVLCRMSWLRRISYSVSHGRRWHVGRPSRHRRSWGQRTSKCGSLNLYSALNSNLQDFLDKVIVVGFYPSVGLPNEILFFTWCQRASRKSRDLTHRTVAGRRLW